MKKESVLRRITEGSGLYGEALPGLPLVEISGDDRILIENHLCVISYSGEKICVKVKFGAVEITGSGLALAYMQSDRLLIRGRIETVSLLRGG